MIQKITISTLREHQDAIFTIVESRMTTPKPRYQQKVIKTIVYMCCLI